MKSLEFKNCSFGYNKNKFVFEDISLEIKSDDTTGYVSAIMGASGCGKTTLLKLILEVEKPFSGQIIKEPTQPVISYVPQDAMLFEHLTPLQNARYFEMINNYKPRFCNKLFDQVSTILELDCILNKSKSIYELSGGERQRLSLLRALSIQPDMLLLDEPLTGLDADVKKEFLIKLREITLQYKLLVLYVTHNNMEPQLIADEIVYMIEDEKQNVIKNISQNDIIEFIRRPPSLEAAKVFKYPDLNILYCTLDNENNIQLF